eukprot:2883095-Alexandrium_andersonii.AAC.1
MRTRAPTRHRLPPPSGRALSVGEPRRPQEGRASASAVLAWAWPWEAWSDTPEHLGLASKSG